MLCNTLVSLLMIAASEQDLRDNFNQSTLTIEATAAKLGHSAIGSCIQGVILRETKSELQFDDDWAWEVICNTPNSEVCNAK